jgi:hypothetical protein
MDKQKKTRHKHPLDHYNNNDFSKDLGGPSVEEKVEELSHHIKNEWQKFKEDFKHQIIDRQDRIAESAEEKRINKSVGRPVKRIIFDRKDNIILNKGDIITFEAVNRAREDNLLENILDSVNFKD